METYKHLFWECPESRRVWNSYNDYLTELRQTNYLVVNYEDVFNIGNNRNLNILKIRVVQAMIQIERPKGWSRERVRKLAMELKSIEV